MRMRVIAMFFGPCASDALTSHVSVLSYNFKMLERFTKLATSSCAAVPGLREKENRQRWIALEELDEENLPEDCGHLLVLYRAWLEGNY